MRELTKVFDARTWEDARKLLVEGHPVSIGSSIVRFYPSYRDVARLLKSNVSKVARWAKREGILEARRQRLATDRIEAKPMISPTTERLVEETLRLINARWATSRLRLSQRTLVTVLKLLAVLSGLPEARLGLVKEVDRLRTSLLKGRMQ